MKRINGEMVLDFAILDSCRVHIDDTDSREAKCPVCDGTVIAKRGQYRIHHWAHKNKIECDRWWENKTEWHKRWQTIFPKECREVCFVDEESGERHIADVCTDENFVIEFQHSFIDSKECEIREKFYTSKGNGMMWVVDASGKRNIKNFKDNCGISRETLCDENFKFYFVNGYLDDVFPEQWIDRSVPVIFDFGISEAEYYLLFHLTAGCKRLIVRMKKSFFEKEILENGKIVSWISTIAMKWTAYLMQLDEDENRRQLEEKKKIMLQMAENEKIRRAWARRFCRF